MPYIYPTRKDKVITALLNNPQGISGREIDIQYFINSGRNEVAELERNHGLLIRKTDVLNETNKGYHVIYVLPNRAEAERAIALLNHERAKCNEPILTTEQVNQYLSRFKEVEQ